MKSTSSHLINFTQFSFARARINDGTIDKIAAKKAIARWRWAVENGHKRPFLHDKNNRKICPVVGSIIILLQEKFNLKAAHIKPASPRQEIRSTRSRGGILGHDRLLQDRERAAADEERRRIAEERRRREEEQYQRNKPRALQIVRQLYGHTTVYHRKVFGNTHVQVRFPDRTEVFYVPKFGATQRKDGKITAYNEAELREKKYSSGKLNDFPTILEILADQEARAMATNSVRLMNAA